MAQTVRTVNDLIVDAFDLIGEFGDEEPIPGKDFERGYKLINLIIDHYSGDAFYIPITKEVSFTLVPGKQDYVFSNVDGIIADVVSNRIIQVEYCNITFADINWVVKVLTRTMLYDNYYNNVIQARPSYVLQKNEVEYTTLSFYNMPDRPYLCTVRGQFYLDKFEKFQPIRNVPLSMQRFLIYELGSELLQYYPSANWSQKAENTYQQLKADHVNTADIDMTARPSTLLRNRYLNYFGLNQSIIGG